VTVLVAAALAAAAAAVLVALPSSGQLRFRELAPQRPPEVRRRAWPVLLPVALLPVLVLGPVVPLLAAAAVLAATRATTAHRRRAAAAGERAGAVEALGALAAELSAGRTPPDALRAAAAVAAGPAAEALRSAAAAGELGGDVPAVLASPPVATVVAPTLRSLAACWSVCGSSGSGLASAVQRLEEGLRADQAQRRAVQAELAGPRATALLLAVLPGGGLLMAGALGADPLRMLLQTPLGLFCLAAGLGLDALGLLWTNRLVSRAGGSG
jgi:tight adherence protein B